MVHEGVMRRSPPVFSDVIWMGMSAAVCTLIVGFEKGLWVEFLYSDGSGQAPGFLVFMRWGGRGGAKWMWNVERLGRGGFCDFNS